MYKTLTFSMKSKHNTHDMAEISRVDIRKQVGTRSVIDPSTPYTYLFLRFKHFVLSNQIVPKRKTKRDSSMRGGNIREEERKESINVL